MLKRFYILSFISVLFFTGCSRSDIADKLLQTKHLKKTADEYREQNQWTLELEKTRLSEKISSMDYISSDIRLNPDAFMAYEAGREKPAVYPEIDGFGSLDISDNDANAMAELYSFMTDFKQGKECETYFDQDSVFSLVLLVNDLSDFDLKNSYWYSGRAFVGEHAVQVPVRMVSSNRYVDMNVYLKEMQAKDSKAGSGTEVKDSESKEGAATGSKAETATGSNEAVVSKYKIVDIEIADIQNIQ